MRVVTSFPRGVRDIENLWIPLSDGVRLAARVWLPDDAERSPVPAILEYIPYRKRDRTRERDEPMHRYFAGHGYAAVRVDLRGTGDSEGVLLDEYHVQEIDDAVEVIRWLACQSWCTGKVGMMGKSWGGFNALQVAARRPDELGAVLSVCASDDRYADDAHYMGGCLLTENVSWGSMLFTLNALPPDPAVLGEAWRSLWLERLERNELFVELWLRHQLRDDYWRHGSVCEDYESIECPVYAVGGWADAYSNAVPRLLEGLKGPRKGLVGPWAHVYPHDGVPGPAIGFLQEALRWWDHWLKGLDTGVMVEPSYRVWMQQSVPPLSFYDERPGRWVAEPAWPSDSIRARRLGLASSALVPLAGAGDEVFRLRSPQTVGLASGSWCAFGTEGEMPRDQREDDGKSLVFDSPPLDETLEIMGAPFVRLRLASDRPFGLVAARLNDVSPDGASTRVTYGLLNLTHRDGHERLAPLEPGREYDVVVRLNDIAHSFASRHRVRLALSSAYWPLAWPSPSVVTLRLFAAGSSLELPVRGARAEDASLHPFAPVEAGAEARTTDLHVGGVTGTITRDLTTNEILYTIGTDVTESGEPAMTRVEETGVEHGHAVIERFRMAEGDPLAGRAEVVHKVVFRGVDSSWDVRVETRTRLSASEKSFRICADLEAFERTDCVFSRSWDRSVPRNGV